MKNGTICPIYWDNVMGDLIKKRLYNGHTLIGKYFLNMFNKEFFKKLNEWIGFIASVISIILFLTEDMRVKIFLYIIVIIYILGAFTYVIVKIFSTDKALDRIYSSYRSKQYTSADKWHSFNHNLRNYTSSVYSNNNIRKNDINEMSVNICNYIAEFYRQFFKDCLSCNDICVCLKTIKPKTLFDTDYMNWEMETIARSVTSSEVRKKIDSNSIKISQNTDFQIIISDEYEDELFAFADMTQIREDFPRVYNGLEYCNSRKDFLEHYKSTIVVPIKIDGKYISKALRNKTQNPNEKNLILGFLCIDSQKVYIKPDELELFKIGVEYAKSFGDSLYLFFEKVLLLSLNCNTISYNKKNINNNTNKYSGRKNRKKNGNNQGNSNKDI